MTVRTRFSPSPTGMIHLGNARAALYSACYATKHHGVFIVRVEDTDATRSEERHVDSLLQDLQWLGIPWQEGPGIGGDYGPYWQSQRQAIYENFYNVLEKNRQIYPCFCTDEVLKVARKVQLSRGLAPRYSGTCRQLTEAQIQKRLAAGEKPAYRFAVTPGQKVEFVDAVKGLQQFSTDTIGDFIIRRADGSAPFLFGNAIDDAMMEISHVLRGEDHLTNTPRQILLLQTLGLKPPQYGHLSLIMGDDGTPLSKRHGSFSVHDLREKGYLPIAIINYLARLGHTFDTQALLSLKELSQHFYLENLSHSAARFDLMQLNYWQKLAISTLETNAVWEWLGDDILNKVPAEKQAVFAKLIKANVIFPHEAAHWASMMFENEMLLDEQSSDVVHAAGAQFFITAEKSVANHGTDFAKVLAEMKQTLQVSGKSLFMPLRIALTGQMHGPELMQIAELLGKEKIMHRLRNASRVAENRVN